MVPCATVANASINVTFDGPPAGAAISTLCPTA
jgi:hypothetical protein